MVFQQNKENRMNKFIYFLLSFLFFLPLFPGEQLEQSHELPKLVSTETGVNSICKIYRLDCEEYRKVFNRREKSIDVFDTITPVKGGTHLLIKCLALMTGMTYSPKLRNSCTDFFHNHFWTRDYLDEFIQRPTKTLTIIRDPRDTLISQCFWSFWHEKGKSEEWKSASISERCKILLNQRRFFGTSADIGFQLDSMRELMNKKNIFIARFENLVGTRGNGNQDLQKKELASMAEFLGIELNEDQYDYMINNLHGSSWTFREGKTGSWRSYFDEEVKTLFKQIYGNYLIEYGYEKDDNW